MKETDGSELLGHSQELLPRTNKIVVFCFVDQFDDGILFGSRGGFFIFQLEPDVVEILPDGDQSRTRSLAKALVKEAEGSERLRHCQEFLPRTNKIVVLGFLDQFDGQI